MFYSPNQLPITVIKKEKPLAKFKNFIYNKYVKLRKTFLIKGE